MIIQESVLRDVCRILVWFPLRWTTAYLPLSMSFGLFRLMGSVLNAVSRSKRELIMGIIKEHLPPACSNSDCARIVRHYFQQHMMNTLFPFIVPRLDRAFLDRNVVLIGQEHLDNALGEGHGCILIQGHVGIVQFPLYYLEHRGYRLGQIFYRHTHGLSWVGEKVQLKYRARMEARLNVQFFSVDDFQRPVVRWLKSNNVLMLNGDGTGGREFFGRYELMTFLGTQVYFPFGPYNLALKMNAPLLPTQVSFDGTKFTITINPPLMTTKSGDDALFDLASQFLAELERHVRQHPETWHYWDSFRKGLLLPG